MFEAMHAHASDSRLTEAGPSRLFVRDGGGADVMVRGRLADRVTRVVGEFAEDRCEETRLRWSRFCDEGFYGE